MHISFHIYCHISVFESKNYMLERFLRKKAYEIHMNSKKSMKFPSIFNCFLLFLNFLQEIFVLVKIDGINKKISCESVRIILNSSSKSY